MIETVTEAGTAVPAFIGHTERAGTGAGGDLTMKPTTISSLVQYEELFGGPCAEEIRIRLVTDASQPGGFRITSSPSPSAPPAYLLYWALKLYFDNGGSRCYIVSTGSYANAIRLGDAATGLAGGLNAVARKDDPTLLVVPEATKLGFAEYASLSQAILAQCGSLRDRFAILDVWGGDKQVGEEVDVGGGLRQTLIEANRSAWTNDLTYGAAYYPFLHMTVNDGGGPDGRNVTIAIDGAAPLELRALSTAHAAAFAFVSAALKTRFITMPPSGAVAGVYGSVDSARGVWKAPANVALAGVREPVVEIGSALQEALNQDPAGRSINSIRSFPGRGTVVWGARTLAGHDADWRYVSVRRFFAMVEESAKESTRWAVFEPNDAGVWARVRDMLERYFTAKWHDGALMGSTPKDAFYVRCGLGTTMTPQDILDHRLNVEIGLAVVRPGEFLVLAFSHQVQSS